MSDIGPGETAGLGPFVQATARIANITNNTDFLGTRNSVTVLSRRYDERPFDVMAVTSKVRFRGGRPSIRLLMLTGTLSALQ